MTEDARKQINDCIVAIAQGDELALERLSCLVSARMLSVAQSVVKSRAIAEEVVQDSFLRLYLNARLFCGGNGYAWICKITQNIAINRLRRERCGKTENIDDFFFLASEDDVEKQSEAELIVHGAMKVLTPFEQRVIYQKYFIDFTVRDSAETLGKSRSAVGRAIKSAEEKIKNCLDSGTKPF